MCNYGAAGARGTGVRFRMRVSLLLWSALLWSTAVNAVERGDIAPDFTLPVLANPSPSQPIPPPNDTALFDLLSLSEYRGRVVYLDFWASSCLSCRESMPLLSRLRDEFDRDDVEIVAVNTDVDPRAALALLEELAVTYPVAGDPAGQVARQYGLKGLPTAYLIGRDGTVRSVHEGFQPQDIDRLRASLIALSGEAGAVPLAAAATAMASKRTAPITTRGD